MYTSQLAQDTEHKPDYAAIQNLVARDMQAVNGYIRQCLQSEVLLINQVSEYIINSGGKRMRPILHLISAGACGYQGDEHIRLAATLEFIHTATLLHDDVVDESDLRRGQDTANAVWGNAASVLVGDFLYSRSFQMMVEVGSMRVMEILSETTNTIAEGEVMQLMNLGNPDADEHSYMEIIRCKTAKLFEAATRLGAVLTEKDATIENSLADYGRHLGLAFQLTDDLLDYTGDADDLGKNLGDDLAEGKPTLPLIYTLKHGTGDQRQMIEKVIVKGDRANLGRVVQAIQSSGALEYTQQKAHEAAQTAIDSLAVLDESESRQALLSLARFAVERTS